MSRRARRVALAVIGVLLGVPALALGAALLIWRASLPTLDGRVTLAGLGAPVTIERDARGIVTLTARDRNDLAFATGFVHGQDRFFQMDLSRRFAAGELAALVGRAALPQDRRTRLYRFRSVARAALAQADGAERGLLDAYTRGVNAGLASLGSRPFEYWLLGASPQPWRAEDSFLVAHAMWWDLQHGDVRDVQLRRLLAERLSARALAFLYPERTAWDAPSVATRAALAAEDARDAAPVELPTPAELDVRGASRSSPRHRVGGAGESAAASLGSNNWAVAGRFTASGAGLVASDMHLRLALPPIWYHVRLRLAGEPAGALDLNGLTLPGEPVLVAGSNGRVAWAFTNSDGQWLDVRSSPCEPGADGALRTPSGPLETTTHLELIQVRGGPDEPLAVRTTPAGLLFEVDPLTQRCWFVSWLAQIPAATNLRLLRLERAASAEEVIALAPEIGIPHQNLVVADRAGHIGWSIAGRVPVATDAGRAARDGPWRSTDSPRLYDPALGRIWTANARPTADADALAALGGVEAPFGAQFKLGARARQIRDALLALTHPATPADMLRIQLDDRALFLARWRELLLSLLDEDALRSAPARAQLRELAAHWEGAAGVDAVGYRIVRTFRSETTRAAWQMMLDAAGLEAEDPPPAQFEQPLWAMVTRQPMHLLAAAYPSWRAFLLEQVDHTLALLAEECPALARCRWGAAHPVRIGHPLARAVPRLAGWLDLPTLELPGDHDMPRVQDGAFGASERFAVTPGDEAHGYLELPGGQSGHPLSPYYRAGYEAWVRGTPQPLLPGPTRHRLTLQPQPGL